jgi:hypothetical protein
MEAHDALELAQNRGAALLDNSTVAGAGTALYPDASIADEQSLADVLEAVVLHDSLVADSWSYVENYPDELVNLSDEDPTSGGTRPIFTQFPFIAAAVPGVENVENAGTVPLVFATRLVEQVLDRLERGLRTGELDRQHDLLMAQLGAGEKLSSLYDAPRDLHEEIYSLYRNYQLPYSMLEGDQAGFGRNRALEEKIADQLRDASEERKLYVMFLLRAFYYEELASIFSLSYVPHTFRAPALLALARQGGGPSSGAFTEYVSGLAVASRAALGQQLGFDVTVDFPPIASRIARDVASREELLPAAMEFRSTDSARIFRGWVADQERVLQKEGNLLPAKRAKEELTEIVAELGAELLGNKREGGHPITLKLTVGVPPVAGEASSEVILRAPSWLRRALRARRPYLTFFSQLARDLVSGNVTPFSKRLRELPPV